MTGSRLARYRTVSVRGRLYAAFLIFVVIGALHTAVAEWAGARRNAAFRDLQSAVARQRVLVQVASVLDEQQKRISLAELLEAEGPGLSEQIRSSLHDHGTRLLIGLDSAAATLPADGNATMLSLRSDVAALLDAWDEFYRVRSTEPTRALLGLVRTADPLATSLLRAKLPAAIQREEQTVERAGHTFAAADAAASRLVWSILALSAGLAVGFAYLLTRHLLQRLARLKDGAERLRTGDLAHRIRLSGRDELAGVADSFDEMAESLFDARARLQQTNTELGEAVHRLDQSRAELIQAEKLKAMGGMLAGLAHELNNPLAGVIGYSELLDAATHERDTIPSAELHALVSPMRDEALRARDMVRNMLHFSRQSTPVLTAVNVAEAMRVATSLRSYAFAQADLRLDIDVPSDLSVVAEPQKLQQVFLNLINNALYALSGGAGTHLRVSTHATGPDVVEIRFTDDGPGFISPECVFDPFYTTKEVGEGTGLGLTLVHRFQEEFGGAVSVCNQEEGGAQITLSFRAAPSCAPTTRAPRPAKPPAVSSMRCVLVVEDEAPLRRLHRAMLSRLSVQVLMADSGASARDILLRSNVDLIVSDVRMPGELDGIQLFSWICEHRPTLSSRFIFVTGDVHDAPLAEMITTRSIPSLTKPFQMEEYLGRVADMLNA